MLSNGGAALDEQSKQIRTRYLLVILILITIPCYVLGFVLLRLNREPKPPTATPVITQGVPAQDTFTPTITLTGYLTRTPTITPTETVTPTETATPTATLTETPSPTPTETATPTETDIEITVPPELPTDTPEPIEEPTEPQPTEP